MKRNQQGVLRSSGELPWKTVTEFLGRKVMCSKTVAGQAQWTQLDRDLHDHKGLEYKE